MTQYYRPIAVTLPTGWSGTAADLADASGVDDATAVISTPTPTAAQVLRVELAPVLVDPVTAATLRIRLKKDLAGGDMLSGQLELRQGGAGVVVATRLVTADVPASVLDYPMVLTPLERAAVTNWGALEAWWTSWAATVGPTPLERGQHPRIALAGGTGNEVIARLRATPSILQALVTAVEARLVAGTSSDGWFYTMDNAAFIYAVGDVPGVTYPRTRAAYGAWAVGQLLAYVRGTSGLGGFFATTFDWVYDLLTTAERQECIDRFLYQVTGRASSTSGFDDGDMLSQAYALMFGIVIAKESYRTSECDAAYAGAVTRFHENGVNLRQRNNAGGGWAQAFDYATHGELGNVAVHLQAHEAYRTAATTATRATYYAPYTYLTWYPEWALAHVTPESTPRIQTWHEQYYGKAASAYGNYFWSNAMLPLAVIAAEARGSGGLAKWLADTYRGIYPYTTSSQARWAWNYQRTHWWPWSAVAAVAPASSASLTHYAQTTGLISWRTGWTAQDTQVKVMAQAWSRPTYWNRHNGAFTIYRNGPLVVKGGAEVHDSWANRTWASSIVQFINPAATLKTDGSYGGPAAHTSTATLVDGNAWDISDGVTHLATPGGPYYCKLGLTSAYQSTTHVNSGEVARTGHWTRSAVFYPRTTSTGSDVLVMCDRANSQYVGAPGIGVPFHEKRWVLQLPHLPVVDGTATPNTPVRADNPTGAYHTTYTRATHVTVPTGTSVNSTLFVTPLAPAVNVVVVGDDRTGTLPYATGGGARMTAYGLQMATTENLSTVRPWAGLGRAEFIPLISQANDVFLVVLEAAAAGATRTVPTALAGSGCVAARIGTHVTVFADGYTDLTSASVVGDYAGSVTVHLADLTPSRTYTVAGVSATATAEGTLVATVAMTVGGTVTITRV